MRFQGASQENTVVRNQNKTYLALGIVLVHAICQERGSVLHHGFHTPRYRIKARVCRLSAFFCVEVFGSRDEARNPSF